MTYFIAMIMFELFYMVYYLSFFLLLFGVIEHFHINLPKIIMLPLGVLTLLMFLLSAYRAKIAAEILSTTKADFIQAHKISGVVIKTYLAFCPIIGEWFQKKDDGGIDNIIH